jgi:hypothetical protein
MAALLAERDHRGLSWAELSRRSGLPVRKLRWWHERFKRNPAPRKLPPAFVAVEVADAARATASAIELTTPSGFRLTVALDFDADHLRRLLQVLAVAC